MISEKKDFELASSSCSKAKDKRQVREEAWVRPAQEGSFTFGLDVTESRVSHISKLDHTFTTAVHKHVALNGVELGRGDDFRKFFHICWLDINNV